jgi:hypothetical protein
MEESRCHVSSRLQQSSLKGRSLLRVIIKWSVYVLPVRFEGRDGARMKHWRG